MDVSDTQMGSGWKSTDTPLAAAASASIPRTRAFAWGRLSSGAR